MNFAIVRVRCFLAAVLLICTAPWVDADEPWRRHVIDSSSKGADGTRLQDVNGDGLPDIVTGWEQGGVTRVAIHPGRQRVAEKWPTVTVGRTPDVEDAVLVDLDGDGALDVVSSSEGDTRRMFVSWGPAQPDRVLDPGAWQQSPLLAAENKMQWMFALPLQIDGQHGADLFAGGKGDGAQLGWLEAPLNARQLDRWKWHPLRSVGWTMSLVAADMDGDKDFDGVFSDRKQARCGVFWLENPGPGESQKTSWKEHAVGGQGREVMFLDLADLDHDGMQDVVVATKPAEVLFLRRVDPQGERWETHTIPYPLRSGMAKAVSVGDIDLDGKLDLVVTCEGAKAPRQGVAWMAWEGSPTSGKWLAHDISGADGVKYDLAPLVDLDGDGDLDVVTSEEVRNLGVVWYENPGRTK